MNTTSQIVSELFNVDRGTLRQAQTEFNATDRILYNFDRIVSQFNHSDPQQQIAHDGFIVNSFDLLQMELKGLQLKNCNSKTCDIIIINDDKNLTDLSSDKDSVAALFLTDELVDQIRKSENCSKLIINIFFQDILFNEEVETNRSTRMIFGVLLPGKITIQQ